MIVPDLMKYCTEEFFLYRSYGYIVYKAVLSFCHGFGFLPGNLKTFWKFFAQKRKKFFSIAKGRKRY